jgi:uncharacterized protein
MSANANRLRPFVEQTNVLLTTYRRTGEGVGTPIHLVVDGDRAVFRTWNTTGKVKRLRNNPEVTIAPSTIRGEPTGEAIRASVRELTGREAARAAQLLSGKYPVMHRLIPVLHRVMRRRTLHYELRPTVDPPTPN